MALLFRNGSFFQSRTKASELLSTRYFCTESSLHAITSCQQQRASNHRHTTQNSTPAAELPTSTLCLALCGPILSFYWSYRYSKHFVKNRKVSFTSFFGTVLSFADLRRNKGFQLAESPYFCLSKQKNAEKKLVKRVAILGHVNRLSVCFLRYHESSRQIASRALFRFSCKQ